MNGQTQFYNPEPLILRNKNYVCKFLCSPVILVLGILQTVSILISFISSFVTSSMNEDVMAALKLFLEDLLEEEVKVEASSSFSIPLTAIAMAIGFFVMYFSAKNGNKNDGARSGATIHWVIAIISLVACCIAAVALGLSIIVLILSMLKLDTSSYLTFNGRHIVMSDDVYGPLMAVLIIFIVIFAIAITFLLIYGISQFRFASSVRKSLGTTELTAKGAKTCGVMNVISAVFSGFALLGSAIGFFATLFLPETAFQQFDLHIDHSSLITVVGISLISTAISFAYNIYMAKYAFGFHNHVTAAGPNGVNLPMPVIAYAPPVQPAYTAPVQPAYTAPETPVQTPSEPETPEIQEAPAKKAEAAPAFCPECGTPVIEGQLFCAECGTKVTAE